MVDLWGHHGPQHERAGAHSLWVGGRLGQATFFRSHHPRPMPGRFWKLVPQEGNLWGPKTRRTLP